MEAIRTDGSSSWHLALLLSLVLLSLDIASDREFLDDSVAMLVDPVDVGEIRQAITFLVTTTAVDRQWPRQLSRRPKSIGVGTEREGSWTGWG